MLFCNWDAWVVGCLPGAWPLVCVLEWIYFSSSKSDRVHDYLLMWKCFIAVKLPLLTLCDGQFDFHTTRLILVWRKNTFCRHCCWFSWCMQDISVEHGHTQLHLCNFYNHSCLCLDLSQAKLAADRERQLLLRDYEAIQRAYRELKAEKSALLEEQVQFRIIMIWEFLLLKYFCGCMAQATKYF